MFIRNIYLLLSLLGGIMTYIIATPLILEHGLEYLLPSKTFNNTIIILIIFLTLITLIFISIEGRSLEINYLWIPILGTILLGPSFGLPFFLYMREVYFHKEIQ